MLYRRRYWVSHGRDGFALDVRAMWVPYLLAEFVTEKILALLGHPCCGRGLGRIRGIDYAAFVFLNAPNRLWRHNREVIRLPLMREQALLLQPDWAEGTWTEDVDLTAGTDYFAGVDLDPVPPWESTGVLNTLSIQAFQRNSREAEEHERPAGGGA